MSSRITCPRFEECDAPLCPVSDYLEDCCWYPDEPICRLRQYQGLDWIRKQKRIAKRHSDNEGYFTLKMIQAIRQVRKGIRGVHPGALRWREAIWEANEK